MAMVHGMTARKNGGWGVGAWDRLWGAPMPSLASAAAASWDAAQGRLLSASLPSLVNQQMLGATAAVFHAAPFASQVPPARPTPTAGQRPPCCLMCNLQLYTVMSQQAPSTDRHDNRAAAPLPPCTCPTRLRSRSSSFLTASAI